MSSAAIILFFILLFKFVADLPDNPGNSAAKGKEFVDILIVAVTVIVVAIPGSSRLVCFVVPYANRLQRASHWP